MNRDPAKAGNPSLGRSTGQQQRHTRAAHPRQQDLLHRHAPDVRDHEPELFV